MGRLLDKKLILTMREGVLSSEMVIRSLVLTERYLKEVTRPRRACIKSQNQ